MPMSNNGPDSEADQAQVFLDALSRFVELAELCLAAGKPGQEPPHYPRLPITELLLDALISLSEASNAWDWPPEKQEAPPPRRARSTGRVTCTKILWKVYSR
jgi:hypothetical protein